ncbi:LysR family transcriptional regulator [Streptomyces sp. NBC_00053]|uniref:LysR family transcriptional regulator n=1 Tax=unclassified Streptomyces TaxID=2593676 RepID=UPI00225330CA|nr:MULTISPECIES: LysR family transcriptional regulator [unclassified Streptomyces]MCX5498235.1 LysR family transcriptional regulator [Streptomyces sp. NBC_00052]MCX5553233.1 LysR family transcriptional regulator [Streptomyces sp. NBC_00051]
MELRILRYFVAVAEELHFGRAATRLHMSQPPLSRAIKQLEADIGALLFARSPTGVTLTPVGTVLLDEARALLDHADRVRVRVREAAGGATITVGILGDGTDPGMSGLAAAYRRNHPGIDIRIRDTDLTDPTGGLRAGLVDVALTRAPFDETALTVRALRSDPVGVVLRTDDPLARHDRLRLAELSDRRWFQFPQDTDPIWRSYWNGGRPREGPMVRTDEQSAGHEGNARCSHWANASSSSITASSPPFPRWAMAANGAITWLQAWSRSPSSPHAAATRAQRVSTPSSPAPATT